MFKRLFVRRGVCGEKRENTESHFFVEGCTQVINSLFNTFYSVQKYSKKGEKSNNLFDYYWSKKMEIQLNKRLSAVAEQGLNDRVFCGIAAGISMGHKGNRSRALFSGGKTRMGRLGRNVNQTTLFDLASLTKPLSTVLCTLNVVSRGILDWEDTLESFFPGAPQTIRIKHLLQHSSGLPAYKPYYQQFPPRQSWENKTQLIDWIVREPLAYPTGSTSVYSDLGFILLGKLIEKCGGMRVDQLFEKKITKPMGLDNQLLFIPIGEQKGGDRLDIAATEECDWRKTTMQGEVHDEHCWLMGGVSGHAGLFGTIEAVMRLAELLLDVWKGYTTHPAFPSALLRKVLTEKHPHSGWCLGFDTPTPGGSSSGSHFCSASVGHLGFSGTSFWIDPLKEVVVVLLTNRIHPTRNNVKIRTYRPYFHDQLMEIIS
ncbi:MAG: serine hydrolase [Desulfobulbus sp.]|nr:serine hydrolase [Desulfobulbus sp.]